MKSWKIQKPCFSALHPRKWPTNVDYPIRLAPQHRMKLPKCHRSPVGNSMGCFLIMLESFWMQQHGVWRLGGENACLYDFERRRILAKWQIPFGNHQWQRVGYVPTWQSLSSKPLSRPDSFLIFLMEKCFLLPMLQALNEAAPTLVNGQRIPFGSSALQSANCFSLQGSFQRVVAAFFRNEKSCMSNGSLHFASPCHCPLLKKTNKHGIFWRPMAPSLS